MEETCGSCAVWAIIFITLMVLFIIFGFIECITDWALSDWIADWLKKWIDSLPRPKEE